jgi:1-acyl-sn-glycerol-3-phosphate acyltransferase
MLSPFSGGPFMIRAVRYVFLALNFIVGSILGVLLGLIRPFNPTNSRWCARIYGSLGLPVIGINVEAEGLENYPTDKPFIVIANHQSNWDLFVVGSVVPNRTVSIGKKNLKWVPLFGQLYWLAGNILIDRGNAKKAMEAMETTKKALIESKTNIWFFAEGTRNHGKNMLPFKKGAFVTAVNAGVPIIRVCTSAYLDGFSMDKLNNGTAKIRVLPEIATKDLSMDDIDGLMTQCHDSMMEVIEELSSTETQNTATA